MNKVLEAGKYRVLKDATYTEWDGERPANIPEGTIIDVTEYMSTKVDSDGDLELRIIYGIYKYVSVSCLERVEDEKPTSVAVLERVMADVAQLAGMEAPKVQEVVKDSFGYHATDEYSIGHDLSGSLEDFLQEALPLLAAARDVRLYLDKVESGKAAEEAYTARRLKEISDTFNGGKILTGPLADLAEHTIQGEIKKGLHLNEGSCAN